MSNELHRLRIKSRMIDVGPSPDPTEYGEGVRSWLTALVGAEHLSLLVGSGLGVSFAATAEAKALDMRPVKFNSAGADAVNAHARNTAVAMGRGEPNVEDQLRSALQLLAGLQVLEPDGEQTVAWQGELNAVLTRFAEDGLAGEASMKAELDADTPQARRAVQLLVGFLLAFASRPPSRERLSVFTTNYDRLIELGSDLGGLRVIDRFVGTIEPVFRASRLELDMHYNPPGIRGEPRYLEGVIRLCKLHGSLDWRFENGRLRRLPLAFGGSDPALETDAIERLMIYPNAAKDVETLLFPYAELFRDLSAALCRPNSVLVTFGYGFGDDHINRVIRDMLTLRSTHLLVISYDDPGGRIGSFLENVAPEQHSVLLGPHFGDLATLADHYLPQPGAERLLAREAGRSGALHAVADVRRHFRDSSVPGEEDIA